jgi:hypothetical protein
MRSCRRFRGRVLCLSLALLVVSPPLPLPSRRAYSRKSFVTWGMGSPAGHEHARVGPWCSKTGSAGPRHWINLGVPPGAAFSWRGEGDTERLGFYKMIRAAFDRAVDLDTSVYRQLLRK